MSWAADEEADFRAAVDTSARGWLEGAPMDPLATPAEPLPVLAGFPYLIASAGAVIVGPTGAGRSSLLQAGAYDAARAGLRVAYLGSEVTEDEFNARANLLAEIRGDQVTDDLRSELAHARYLDLATVIIRAWADPSNWVKGMAAAYDVVLIDPLSAVASALDLNFDQLNQEYVQFYDKLIQPLTARGPAVAMAENLGHALEAKGRAKGVSAKGDRADLTFACTRVASPAALAIKVTKVRSVRAPFKFGDQWIFDRDKQTVERWREDAGESSSFRPTLLMQRVSETVSADPGLSKRAIRGAVKGRNDTVDLALELLVAEGYVEAREEGQANKHYPCKRYVNEENQPNRPPVPQPCPNRAPGTVAATVPTVPHPFKGTGTGHGSPDTVSNGDRAPTEIDADSELDRLAAKLGNQ